MVYQDCRIIWFIRIAELYGVIRIYMSYSINRKSLSIYKFKIFPARVKNLILFNLFSACILIK